MYKFSFTFVLICVCIVGCGGEAQAPPAAVYAVSGTVTFKGQPLVGADVTFINAEKSRSAFGRTNQDGEYRLTTFSSNDGAVDGKSAVTIAKFISSAPAAVTPETESEDYQPPGFGEEEPEVELKSDIPAQYADQATSGLIAVVNAEGVNQIDFNLE